MIIRFDGRKFAISEQGVVTKGKLPYEYQEVEYIQSTGTQYIDTLVYPTNKTKFVFKYNLLSDKTYKGSVLLGCKNGENGAPGIVYSPVGAGYRFGGYNWIAFDNFNKFGVHNVVLEYKKANVDGIIYETKDNSWAKMNYSCTIFKQNWGGVFEFNYSDGAQLHYLQIIEDNNLVRDLIPCYNTAQVSNVDGKNCDIGTIGMYDAVENRFYTNKGTGEFLKGNNVN